MNPQIAEALQLLVVGMATVFVILALVVFMGKQLILIVNRVMPAAASSKSPQMASGPSSGLPPKTLAAIVATVDMVTEGKGHVGDITKLP